MTTEEWTPSLKASAQAASTASSPSVKIALRISTIRCPAGHCEALSREGAVSVRHPAELALHAPHRGRQLLVLEWSPVP